MKRNTSCATYLSPRNGLVAGLALAIFAIGAGNAIAANNSVTGQKKEEFQTAAPYAILLDADNGTVLFEKNADTPTPPSSLAKLMTVEVVANEIVQGRLTLDTEFLISEDAWRRGGAPSHTSSMFAPLNSRVRVQDLLQAVVIQSANDACIALAQGIAANETAFAIQMNARARELGLTNSKFTNSTGLPDRGMQASVRDLAKLARHLIRTYPQFYSYYAEKEFTWNKIRQFNRNPLLAMNIGADGMKTGFTNDGGYGLVGSAIQNGWRLVVVVNGLKGDKERGDEGKRLLEWGYRTFEPRLLFAEGQNVGEAKVYGGEKGSVPLVGAGPINIMVPRNASERIVARIVYTGPVHAPIEQGQAIGKLRVSRGDIVALEVPLSAGESVSRGGVTGRAFDAASELVIGLFRRTSQK
ncbi:MAG: D-alanyl-D-alanine carboxypeptidase family protein [Xanthobacteraceae bacterium]